MRQASCESGSESSLQCVPSRGDSRSANQRCPPSGPGGGVEEGEIPEEAVRRELCEELGTTLTGARQLGLVVHVRFWKGRGVRERSWLLLANSSDDARLSRGECPELSTPTASVFGQPGARSKRTSHPFHFFAP